MCITFTLVASRVIYFYGAFSLSPSRAACLLHPPPGRKSSRIRGDPTARSQEGTKEKGAARRVPRWKPSPGGSLCPLNGVTGLPWLRNPMEPPAPTAPRPLESPFILEKHYKKERSSAVVAPCGGTSHRPVSAPGYASTVSEPPPSRKPASARPTPVSRRGRRRVTLAAACADWQANAGEKSAS